MAQTYSFEDLILLNYDKLPDGVDMKGFDYEESEMIREVNEIKDELNHLKMGPSKNSIKRIMDFSAAYCSIKTGQGDAEMILN